MKTSENESSSVGRRRAFSLIELLIVMAIIVILYFMYFSAGSQSFQQKQMKVCQKNLQMVYVAMKTYAQENESMFPVLPDAATSEAPLSLLVPRYTTSTEYFICPGSGDSAPPPAQPFTKSRISYAYYMGARPGDGASQPLMSDEQVDASAKTNGAPLFSADGEGAGNNHNKFGGVILFSDGSLKTSDTNAEMPLPLNRDILLLNPKP